MRANFAVLRHTTSWRYRSLIPLPLGHFEASESLGLGTVYCRNAVAKLNLDPVFSFGLIMIGKPRGERSSSSWKPNIRRHCKWREIWVCFPDDSRKTVRWLISVTLFKIYKDKEPPVSKSSGSCPSSSMLMYSCAQRPYGHGVHNQSRTTRESQQTVPYASEVSPQIFSRAYSYFCFQRQPVSLATIHWPTLSPTLPLSHLHCCPTAIPIVQCPQGGWLIRGLLIPSLCLSVAFLPIWLGFCG